MMIETTDDDLPLLGPHNDRELELMLAGRKPAAMFDEFAADLYADDFPPHVAAGRILKIARYFPDANPRHDIRRTVYVLPGEEWRADAVDRIHHAFYRGRGWKHEYNVEIGRLLG